MGSGSLSRRGDTSSVRWGFLFFSFLGMLFFWAGKIVVESARLLRKEREIILGRYAVHKIYTDIKVKDTVLMMSYPGSDADM